MSEGSSDSARDVPAIDPQRVPPELEHFGNYHLLSVLGRAPGNFDMLFYDAERHGVSAW